MLASNNAKKLLELQALFERLAGATGARRRALQIAEADEPHGTFVENALAKARHAARARQAGRRSPTTPAFASMRSAASPVSPRRTTPTQRPTAAIAKQRRARQDAANTALLLQRMRDATDRRARFVSTLVALRHARRSRSRLIAFGRWELELLHEPRGSGGFGYDPVVRVPTHDCSVAELAPVVKNQISHRALRRAGDAHVDPATVWRLD